MPEKQDSQPVKVLAQKQKLKKTKLRIKELEKTIETLNSELSETLITNENEHAAKKLNIQLDSVEDKLRHKERELSQLETDLPNLEEEATEASEQLEQTLQDYDKVLSAYNGHFGPLNTAKKAVKKQLTTMKTKFKKVKKLQKKAAYLAAVAGEDVEKLDSPKRPSIEQWRKTLPTGWTQGFAGVNAGHKWLVKKQKLPQVEVENDDKKKVKSAT